jgi:hypothetical protein
MSLLFRSGGAQCRGAMAAVAGAAAIAGMTAAAPTARAAEIYYQPVVSLSTSYNTNLYLTPGQKISAEGYFADAATFIGIATPTSQTTLEPRLLYNYYPTQSGRNRLEEFLNLASNYRGPRDRFSINGLFNHRDDVNAEQVTADVNPVTPGLGNTTPTTGRILVGTTRDWLILDPTYSHTLTPLTSIGVGGEYQRVSYSLPDTSSHVNFNYYLGRVFYSWTHSQRTDYSLSAFGSRYVASNIDSKSTSGGVSGDMNYNWTQTLQTGLSAAYQRVKVDEITPRTLSQTANTWSANLSTVYTGPASSYRATIGRTIAPSAAGGLFATDQARGQYDRDFTQRLHFTGAVRYFRDRTIAGVGGNDTRDYLTTLVRVQWMVTQRLFIGGAYTFVWQKYRADPSGADANIVQLDFGYKGLGRQQ